MIIKIRTRPGAKEEKIEKISEIEYRISVKEQPDKNRANDRIIKILSKELNIESKNIRIKNPSSRTKYVEV